MGIPPNLRRIRVEDFEEKDRDLAGKLSLVLTEFMDQTIFLFNKHIDFNNLNQQLVDIDISTDPTGKVVNPPKIKTNINGKVIGILVINATNLVNPVIYPTGQPFVNYSINTSMVNILNITNLQINSQYRLKLLLIGDNIS